MTVLGNLRRRITLMREEKIQGAGGRFYKNTPIIADVWATVSEVTGGAEERADKQIFTRGAEFSVRYSKPYLMTRVIKWRGQKYRVTSTQTTEASTPMLNFSARLLEEDML
ncbi:MAG: phage head closure protein [Kordiimonas sp.]